MRSLPSALIAVAIATQSISYAENCEPLFSKDLKEPEIEWISDQVAILFYPEEWHAELLVNGQIYNRSILGPYYPRSFTAAKRAATKYSSYNGFVAYYIRVSGQELENIENYLNTSRPRSSLSCMYGACKVINETTDMRIPRIISHFPLSTAIYFLARKSFGGSFGRVQKIEVFAKNGKLINFQKPIFLETLMLGTTTITLVIVLTIIITTVDGMYELIVPILTSPEEGKSSKVGEF